MGNLSAFPGRVLSGKVSIALILASTFSVAFATENAGAIYPAGVDTVLPGLTPPPGATMLMEFNAFYMANAMENSKGQSEVPGFHLRIGAWAPKIQHNWGVKILGGTLVSSAAIPFIYEALTVPGAAGSKIGVGNADLQFGAIAYAKGDWHWYYGFDYFTPGLSYGKNQLINIGQHYVAYTPSAAFTYLPHRGSLELSSRFQYFFDGPDSATLYQSGREFLWEYDGMKRIGRRLSVGGNGFFYRQVSNDLQNGLIVGDGNRGRDLALGPEIRCHLGPFALIAKYQKDMLVENRPIGSTFWLQFGMPLGRPHE